MADEIKTPYTPTPAQSAEAAEAAAAPVHPYHSTSDSVVRESDVKRPSDEAVKDTVETQAKAAEAQAAVADVPTPEEVKREDKAAKASPSQAEQEKLAGNPPKAPKTATVPRWTDDK